MEVTHEAVVGNVLWVALFMYWLYEMSKRQLVSTTVVVRE